MEALRDVRVWAKDNRVAVTVVEDLDNRDFRQKERVRCVAQGGRGAGGRYEGRE
jgi:hypothetical protein